MADGRWSGEVLIPPENLEGYRLVFEAETWLRRVCLAALILEEGTEWSNSLDDKLRSRLDELSKHHRSHWYLGFDAEEELLWSTTHGQLAHLLQIDGVDARVMRLCGVHGSVLAERLRSVAVVRNALAHNRAISEETLTILRGDLAVIRAAVDRFKLQTLYAESEIFLDAYPQDLQKAGECFRSLASRRSGQQLFMSANADFVFLVRLPVEPFGVWPNSRALRETLGPALHLVLCILVNKMGDEFQFVMPRSLPVADQLRVIESFDAALASSMWVTRPPEDQHPADVCWPRLWFYENQHPER